MNKMRAIAAALALVAGLGSAAVGAAQPGVPEGIAAWQAGNYEQAVALWRPLAQAGNADAQFNLGQAYRLGRGVGIDVRAAEQWFEQAARQRHEQAGTNLGLLLFQNGRAREAMPWIQAAAMRGDPRAQYVFGTALYNGDILRRDLPRAYAMMTLATRQNFPQAADQLRQMEAQLSAEDRARGLALARSGDASVSQGAAIGPQVAAVEPPVRRNDGAGVSWQPQLERAPAAEQPALAPHTRPAPPRQSPVRAVAAAPGGRWRVQLGAFSSAANARRQWDNVRRRVSPLGGLQPVYVSAGPLTRLRAGPLASRAAADRVCAAVRSAGGECIAVVP